MMNLKSIVTTGAMLCSVALFAQTGIAPAGSKDRDGARGAGTTSRDGREKPSASGQNEFADQIAEAYTRTLYLSEQEESKIRDRINGIGRELEAAVAQLAKAQLQLEAILDKEMKAIDEGFNRTQQGALSQKRLSGEWDCMVDPCKCGLQPKAKRGAGRAAAGAERTRSAAPEKGGNDSRITPDGGRPTKR